MVLDVVRDGMAPTFLALDETVELDLCLMVGERDVLGATDSAALLLDGVEQAEGVSVRLEGIEVVPVSYLSSEVFVAAPQDGGEHFTEACGVTSLFGHHLLAFGPPPVLGSVRIVVHIFIAWLGQMIEYLWLMVPDSLTRVVAVLEGRISRMPLVGIPKCGWYEGTECSSSQFLRQCRRRLPGVEFLEACIYSIFIFVGAWLSIDLVGYGSCSTLLG